MKPSQAKELYQSGKVIRYRNKKGQFTTPKNYEKLIKDGIITYNPKTTNNPTSVKTYSKTIGIEVEGVGEYKVEKIITENGKEIYLTYQTNAQREDILQKIINSTTSPPLNPRPDNTKITKYDKAQLKQQRYATQKIDIREYKDLATFTATEFKDYFKR